LPSQTDYTLATNYIGPISADFSTFNCTVLGIIMKGIGEMTLQGDEKSIILGVTLANNQHYSQYA
jgi:hypothetical protein